MFLSLVGAFYGWLTTFRHDLHPLPQRLCDLLMTSTIKNSKHRLSRQIEHAEFWPEQPPAQVQKRPQNKESTWAHSRLTTTQHFNLIFANVGLIWYKLTISCTGFCNFVVFSEEERNNQCFDHQWGQPPFFPPYIMTRPTYQGWDLQFSTSATCPWRPFDKPSSNSIEGGSTHCWVPVARSSSHWPWIQPQAPQYSPHSVQLWETYYCTLVCSEFHEPTFYLNHEWGDMRYVVWTSLEPGRQSQKLAFHCLNSQPFSHNYQPNTDQLHKLQQNHHVEPIATHMQKK